MTIEYRPDRISAVGYGLRRKEQLAVLEEEEYLRTSRASQIHVLEELHKNIK
jgi:hypothetical protein